MKINRNKNRLHRKRRVRAKIEGTAKKPRLCVFRSTKAVYAQLIDDEKGVILVTADSRELKSKKYDIEAAAKTGELIGKKAEKAKIENVLFDRGGYKYHGKVRALAEGARKSGLKF